MLEYLPAVHEEHEDCVEDVYVPGLHSWQAEAVLAPDELENFPASQLRHVAMLVAPATSEYFPAAQDVQDVADVAEYRPAGQMRHVSGVMAAKALEYFPASQLMHVVMLVAPSTVEYLPPEQPVQEVACTPE